MDRVDEEEKNRNTFFSPVRLVQMTTYTKYFLINQRPIILFFVCIVRFICIISCFCFIYSSALNNSKVEGKKKTGFGKNIEVTKICGAVKSVTFPVNLSARLTDVRTAFSRVEYL